MSSNLKSIKLNNFRGYKDFTVNFSTTNFLVGPNNAGKTTLLTALRLADIMIKYARSLNPQDRKSDAGLGVVTYPMPVSINSIDFQAAIESVYHNFENDEARIMLTWSDGRTLTAVWPSKESGEAPYFYLLTRRNGQIEQPKRKSQVLKTFNRLGIIPILSPLDYREKILKEDHVKRSADSRIATKHFRNNIYLLDQKGSFEGFANFLAKWVPEIELLKPELTVDEAGGSIDIFYREKEQAAQKEVIWSGDGIQIWLQILFHIFRIGETNTIILDEPEVYLHPDLQRRLIRLLDSLGVQIILATHSTEIISEAETGSVIMIDKTKKRGFVIETESVLEELTDIIGTGVDLRLARSLKTKVVFFVEGQDMKLLSILCEKFGFDNIVYERNITTIPLGGKSRYVNVMPFKWLEKNLLGGSKRLYVLLDRDYQSDEEIRSLESAFNEEGISGHVWRYKELESYLISPTIIAAVTSLSSDDSMKLIEDATADLKADILGNLVSARSLELKKARPSIDIASVVTAVTQEVEAKWGDLEYRLQVCPAKSIIKAINSNLPKSASQALSARKLAQFANAQDLPVEVRDFLGSIDGACNV